jgi:hypothetical protein
MVAAGVALALAFSTRYAALTVLPALLIYDFRFTIYDLISYVKRGAKSANTRDFNQTTILTNHQSKIPDSKSPNRQSSIINRQFPLLVAFGLVSLPQMVINFAWPKPFWNHPWLTGWSPLNYIKTAFDTPDGHAVYDRPPAVFYGLEPFWNLHFLTPLLIPLALAGFISLWARQRRSWPGWALVLWWLVPVLCYSGMPYENERFTLTLLPPLAIISGLGLAALYDKVRSKKAEVRNDKESVESIDPDKIAVLPPVVTLNPKPKIQRSSSLIPHPSSLILLTSAFLLLPFLCWVGQRHMEGFFAFKNDELNTVQAAEMVLPSDAQVLTFGVSLTYDHYYPVRPVFDLSATGQSAIMDLLNQNRPLYLLTKPEVMESQFAATPIGASYRVARQLAVEPPLLEYKGYYLWRLRPGSNS